MRIDDRLAARVRTYTLGKAGFAVPAGSRREIVLPLTPRGRRIIGRVSRLRLTVRIVTRGRGGARVTTTRRATIRIPRG